jgi:tripartite-type tricarboxylate transporter receptor subunit TctC
MARSPKGETAMHRTIWAAACIVLAFVATGAGAAQNYPNKPVRVIFAFAAGGAGDVIARAYGQKFAERFGQGWVLDNRGGAGSTLGTDLAAKAVPDGYTLFQANMTLCVSYAAYAKLPYDPVRDFAPITTTVNVTSFLAVTPTLPVNNVKELIAYAKARPGQLSYASAGQGSTSHFSAELFNRMAGIQMAHVPYKGTGPALPDLLAGRVHLVFEPMVTMLPHVKAGRMKALGVTSLKRSPAAPEIPSLAEQGMEGYDVVLWYGMLAPTGTPKPIIDKLNAALVEFAASPDIREKLSGLGADPTSSSQAEFAAIIRRDITRWKKVAAEAGIRL